MDSSGTQPAAAMFIVDSCIHAFPGDIVRVIAASEILGLFCRWGRQLIYIGRLLLLLYLSCGELETECCGQQVLGELHRAVV
jgi:hypothetical protein